MTKHPFLSICIITYNHNKYIAQAIESFLHQKTTFPFEIVIGEDFSIDNTRDICLRYAEKDDRIRVLPRTSNLGMLENFKQTFLACNGKYVAFCEGDDYWTDNDKLQKQVDILEKSPEFSFCFHKGYELDDIDQRSREDVNFEKQIYNFRDFAQLGCFIKTMSVVMKRNLIDPDVMNKDWYYQLSGTDHLFFLLLINKGNAFAINEYMGVYRLHEGGVWSGISNIQRLYKLEKDVFFYKKNLNFNFHQKLDLNWQLKIVLIGLFYQNKSRNIFNRIRLIFINRIVFIFGPGYISGLIVCLWYHLVKNNLKLYNESD